MHCLLGEEKVAWCIPPSTVFSICVSTEGEKKTVWATSLWQAALQSHLFMSHQLLTQGILYNFACLVDGNCKNVALTCLVFLQRALFQVCITNNKQATHVCCISISPLWLQKFAMYSPQKISTPAGNHPHLTFGGIIHFVCLFGVLLVFFGWRFYAPKWHILLEKSRCINTLPRARSLLMLWLETANQEAENV